MPETRSFLEDRATVEERYRKLFWRIAVYKALDEFPLPDRQFQEFINSAASLTITQNDFVIQFSIPDNITYYYHNVEHGLYRALPTLYEVLEDAVETIPVKHCRSCLQLTMLGSLCQECLAEVYQQVVIFPEVKADMVVGWKRTNQDMDFNDGELFYGRAGMGYQPGTLTLPAGPSYWHATPSAALGQRRDGEFLLAALMAPNRRYLKENHSLLSWGTVLPVGAIAVEPTTEEMEQSALFEAEAITEQFQQEMDHHYTQAIRPHLRSIGDSKLLLRLQDNWPATQFYA